MYANTSSSTTIGMVMRISERSRRNRFATLTERRSGFAALPADDGRKDLRGRNGVAASMDMDTSVLETRRVEGSDFRT
ncbi:hypothetical protein GCM10023160_25750 [Brachybacterium paraconglomeratum]